MDVGPLQHLPVETDPRESAPQVRVPPPQSSGSGSDPVRVRPEPQKAPLVPAIVEDDVKVQLDTATQVRIYQFVKHPSGALVVQVPSEEVMNVTRGIRELLQQQQEMAQQQSDVKTPGTDGRKNQ
jgi:hypothetical protein